MNPDVNDTFILPARAGAWPAFLRRLRRAGITHVFDLDNNDRTALLSRITGAPFRAALWFEGQQARWRSLYTADVRDPAGAHEQRSIVEYYLSILQSAQIPITTREVRLVPRPQDVAAVAKLVGGPKTNAASRPARVLVHPGSRSAWRMWPSDRFAQICDRLQDELGVHVFLVGGPGEQEMIAAIRAHTQLHVVPIHAALTVPQFAALASQVDLMLCHDSGPMHVAAAVGTPVVALLGSQNPTVFAPAGHGHTLLQAPLPCKDCVAPHACKPADSYHNYCVRRITTDTVWETVRARLAPVR